jgi:hypothetical protein
VYDPLISKRQQYLLATQVRVDIVVFLVSQVYSLGFVAGPRGLKDRFVLCFSLPAVVSSTPYLPQTTLSSPGK